MSCSKEFTNKVFYFQGRGRAELIRWIFTFAKVQFEDHRYSMRDEWPSVKPTMPLGQLPVVEIEINGVLKKLSQTSTIVRTLAGRYGLLGDSPQVSSFADEAYELIREIGEHGWAASLEKDETRKASMLENLKNDMIPRNLGFLDRRISEFGGQSVAGSFSFADLALACMLDGMGHLKIIDRQSVEQDFPNVHALAKRVTEIPQLAEYIAKRPETIF